MQHRLTLLVLLIVSLVQRSVAHKTYTCQFDHLYANRDTSLQPGDKPDEVMPAPQARGLQAITRSPIRITLDTTDFNSIKTTTHGEAVTTSARLTFLKRTMLIAEYFYEQRLKVSTISRIFAPTSCQGLTPSINDRSNGISSSDLHIYVRYITDNTITYGATGVSCKWVTSQTLPDLTFQQGRPTFGGIIFNTYRLVDQQTSLTNRLFASITATALHETMHILGFDSSLYSTYLSSSTGNVYGAGNYLSSETLNPSRTGGANDILITPKVKDWAIDFFACGSLNGMALENQEGTGSVSSHWERLAMYDELMTATQLGAQKGFSGLTFALLEDMGWYEVDDTFNDTSNYGYHLGCSFYNDACYSATTFSSYFCDMTAYSGVSACATNFLSKAVCTNQAAAMTDSCGILGGYFHCVDPATSDDGYKSYTLEKYTTGSFCVDSTFANVGISSKYRGRCYPYVCSATTIVFTVGTNTVTCSYSPSDQAGTQKTINSLNGYLVCPIYQSFCEQSRKICPNWCSQNGFCTRGICNCYTGYYGKDCSKTSCTSLQYYDETNNICVSSCPSGTYQNSYSRSCLPCDSACTECRDEPTICTGCLSTPQQKLYFVQSNSSCMNACPPNTYQQIDSCKDCDATVAECATCSQSETNCTSCLNNKFLENPNFGSCVSTCPNSYRLYDVVNHKCVSGCTDNLIYYTGGCADCPVGTDGICDVCANGQYKLITTQACIASCPPTYYENDDRWFCEQCHSSCLQCDGAYAENCTECDSSSAEKYLLLKMCVSSCPRGFFPNDVDGTCEICSVDLNCATCETQAGTTNVICSTCKYGYYFNEADSTCNLDCDPYYYKNAWNHSCDACNILCGECTSGSASSCTTCPSNKYFLANISGGYCLDSCPTEYYVRTGFNCLDCYTTCKTCNGVSSSSCLTCVSGLFLSDGMCRYVCPGGSFPNPVTGTCDLCDNRCTFCFDSTVNNCTACANGLVLNNFTCTTSCSGNLTVNQWGVCFENHPLLSVLLVSLVMMGLMA